MRRATVINILAVSVILLCAGGVGWYGFVSPNSFEDAARTAVSSLSIIFGLTAAMSSLLHVRQKNAGSLSNDPATAERLGDQLDFDDNRTILRQSILHVAALLTILLGLAYLVVLKDAPHSLVTKVIAAAFGFGTTLSLMSALFLPRLLAVLIKRNAYFQSRGSN